MNKPGFKIVKDEAKQRAEIYLYGIIGDFWDNDNPITARVLQNLLYSVSEYPRVDIRLNGPGGDTLEAFPMANLIKSFSVKQDIHTYNDGICASAFIILLEAVKAENRHGAKGSMAMIHSAATSAWGNSNMMQETKEMLEKYDETIAQFISDAIGVPVKDVVGKWFDGKDHWMTAIEAEQAGLYKVEDYAAVPMPENVTNMKVDKVAAFFKQTSNNIQTTDMSILNFNNFKKISALGKVPVQDRTTNHFKEANEELAAEGITGATIVSDQDLKDTISEAQKVPALSQQVTDLGVEKTSLTQRVTDLEKQLGEAKAQLKKPAEETTTPVTDQTDSTGEKPVVNKYETEHDRQMKAKFGNK